MAVPPRIGEIGNGCLVSSLANSSWPSTTQPALGGGRCFKEFSSSDNFASCVCSSSQEILNKPDNMLVEQISWNGADVSVESTLRIHNINNSKQNLKDRQLFYNNTMPCVQPHDQYHAMFPGFGSMDGSGETTTENTTQKSESRKRTTETFDVRSPQVGKRANNKVLTVLDAYDIDSAAPLPFTLNSETYSRRGLAKDPQSVAARLRRKRINTRLKVLRDLITDGSKMDLVTMLEKAIIYVKCLQLQVKILTDDEYWLGQGKGVAALSVEQLAQLPDVTVNDTSDPARCKVE